MFTRSQLHHSNHGYITRKTTGVYCYDVEVGENRVRLFYGTEKRKGKEKNSVMSTVPSVRDHCGRGRTAKSPSVRGQDGNGAVFLRQGGDGRQ